MSTFHASRTRVRASIIPSAAFMTRSSEMRRMTLGFRTIFFPWLVILFVRRISAGCS